MGGKKLRLALLVGGSSGERDVSLKGADEVYRALDHNKYEVRRYDIPTDLGRLTADAGELDVAFILLHGRHGEDGTIQGLLELLGIPYQGSSVLGSAVAMDKNISKILYREAGLTVPDWLMVTPADADEPKRLLKHLRLPLAIKPSRQGSSLGISIARFQDELADGLTLAFNYDKEVVVEEYITGREITVGVLGNDKLTPLPMVEIIPVKGSSFFDYKAKYKAGGSEEVCPAELSEELTTKAKECALTAHRALQLRGYSRTDMIIKKNDIYILETNTIPGMTPTSLLPQAAAADGISFSQLLDLLLKMALEK